MSFPRHSFRTKGWGGRDRPCASGFTLAEMMLVLLVVLLAVTLLFTYLGRENKQRNEERFIADLREFAGAFLAYQRQHRTWPPSTTGGAVLPRGLDDVLVETKWADGSPFGGSYGWDARGAVVLTAYAPAFPLKLTRADLVAIDRRFDDGNLATGRFRTGFNGWPVYLVGENP